MTDKHEEQRQEFVKQLIEAAESIIENADSIITNIKYRAENTIDVTISLDRYAIPAVRFETEFHPPKSLERLKTGGLK